MIMASGLYWVGTIATAIVFVLLVRKIFTERGDTDGVLKNILSVLERIEKRLKDNDNTKL